MESILAKIDEAPGLSERFGRMCRYYAELARREGVAVEPFAAPDMPVFSALTEEQKKEAISDIRTALEIFEEMANEGQSISNSPQLLWRGLRKFGWVPQSDIFGRIADGDLFQIYSPTQKLIFSNLQLFGWLSFSLEEVYAGKWFQLMKRETSMTMRLYEAAMKVLSGEVKATFDPQVPEHLVEEIDSRGLKRFRFLLKCVSPLKKAEEIVGFIAVIRCREAG